MKTKKQLKLFNPDELSTEIHRSLSLDLTRSGEQLYAGSDVLNLFREVQCREFKKKYTSALDQQWNANLTIECFNSFKDRISFVGGTNRRLAEYFHGIDKFDTVVINRIRLFIDSVLGPAPDFLELFQACRHSAGATVGTTFKDSSLLAKSTFPFVGNRTSQRIFELYLEYDWQYNQAVEAINKLSTSPKYQFEYRSSATSVEKDDTKRRLVLKEPTLHMFFQKGIEAIMVDRLRPLLDISKAQLDHQQKAYLASITRKHATVDLKDASDLISLELVRNILPLSWLNLLECFRSTHTVIDEEEFELPMFSTMGNAYTFPLETLVFLSVVVAVTESLYTSRYSALAPEWSEIKRLGISVYGDDIIIPSEFFTQLSAWFTKLGFVMNTKKSHFLSTDKFRESCGSDYISGRNVRPYFIKAPANTRLSSCVPWLMSVFNRLVAVMRRVYGRNYIYILWDTLKLTLMFVKQHNGDTPLSVVPEFYPDDSGFKLGSDERLLELFKLTHLALSNSENNHGTNFFHFRRWRFPESTECEPLRLWENYRFGSMEQPVLYQKKIRGGYVVGKGCYHVPFAMIKHKKGL